MRYAFLFFLLYGGLLIGFSTCACTTYESAESNVELHYIRLEISSDDVEIINTADNVKLSDIKRNIAKLKLYFSLLARKANKPKGKAKKKKKKKDLIEVLCERLHHTLLGQILSYSMVMDGANPPSPTELDVMVKNVLTNNTNHTNLGKALASVKRRINHLPESGMTLVPGGDSHPKVRFETNGKDNIGLAPFSRAFGLEPLTGDDLLIITANGVPQETIESCVWPYIKKGYRPLGARMLIRVMDEQGNLTLGAEYVECVDALLGTLVQVRSYFSLGSAPALHEFHLPKEGLYTEREGEEEDKKILFFAGKAKELFEDMDGTEGSLPISEKAMEKIYGISKPGQPRLILRLKDKLNKIKAVLFKGNHSLMAMRAFLQDDGTYKFYPRGHFSNTEEGTKLWRKGHDFVFLEDDTPKGSFKSEVQVEDGYRLLEADGNLNGWLIATAQDKNGKSLVSYQVLALLADCLGLTKLADGIRDLVNKSVAKDVALTTKDLNSLELNPNLVDDLDKMIQHLSAKTPFSAKKGRQNHFGFGAKMTMGYVFMNSLLKRGVIAVSDEFGLTKGQIKADAKIRKKNIYLKNILESTGGGKNPILDSNQVFLGSAVRLSEIFYLRDRFLYYIEHHNGNPVHQEKYDLDRANVSKFLNMDENTTDVMITKKLNWLAAFSPSMTRGSVIMNHEDVADLAGDDDGDMLWFSFRNEKVLSVFKEVKAQAKGNTLYNIENNKKAQLPSDVGNRNYADMLTAQGEDLMDLVRFIMAPNKGQGPVGYLANLCTILITVFKKIENGDGGMKFENIWVERLQAALNYMQQTSIDLQKRIYATLCLILWTLADFSKSSTGNRGLVPGFDFPALAHEFNKEGFDPDSFTVEQYKDALQAVDMPMIPHHWNGQLMAVCTDQDAQYSITALGSWLVWEIVSLVATGKPAAWSDKIHNDAKGGIDPHHLASMLDDGPTNAIWEALNLSDDLKSKVESVWVEKPRTYYYWKVQNKSLAFEVEAPPALQMNHLFALEARQEHLPTGNAPVLDFKKIDSEMFRLLKCRFNSTKNAKFFVEKLLQQFYEESKLSNQSKASSEKFQGASERSGVEALNLLLDAFDVFNGSDFKQYRKVANSFEEALNPRIKMENKDEIVGLITMFFSWYQINIAPNWAYEFVKRHVGNVVSHEKKKVKKVWLDLGFSQDEVNSLVTHNSKLKQHPNLVKVVSELVSENQFEVMQAKSTWFIDEGLIAFVKATERGTMIASKRDLLKSVGDACRIWHSDRNSWSDDRVPLEILLCSLNGGTALWLEDYSEELSSLIDPSNSLSDEDYKELVKNIKAARNANTNDNLKELKKTLRKHKFNGKITRLIDKIKSCEDLSNAGKVKFIDEMCNPNLNPHANLFIKYMMDNLGPFINVERAWRRAHPSMRQVLVDWTGDLGDWITLPVRDRETGKKKKKKFFFANSRVEWSLADGLEAYFCRVLLEAGVSHYKLTKVPGRSSKTWRLFDAFVNALEPLTDFQISNGFGHLISLTVPTSVDADKYSRMAHLALLEEVIQEWQDVLNEDPTDTYANTCLTGYKSEKVRLKGLENNGLMVRWGGLYYPVTWGMVLPSFAGQLTKKALNGRAWMALAKLGQFNALYHEQAKTSTITLNGQEVQVSNVTTKLKPLNTNRQYMPFHSKKVNKKGVDRRLASRQSAKYHLDDTIDLIPFSWDCNDDVVRKSFVDWIDFIETVASEGKGCTSGLVLSALWFKANTGRIAYVDPLFENSDSAIVEKCWTNLMKTSSYEARLHLADLKAGEFVKPVYPETTKKASKAFFTMLKKIVNQ